MIRRVLFNPGRREIAGLAIVAFAVAGLVQCVRTSSGLPTPDRRANYIPKPDDPLEPAFVPPPRPEPSTDAVPPLGGSDTAFPYLPGEDRSASRSIGGVVHGHLVSAAELPRPHSGLGVLATQHGRDLDWATDRMIEILAGTASKLREKHPDSVVWLGNLGRRTGGDIPYSVSHNSGRDADLAFLLEGPDGSAVVPNDLVELDRRGRGTVGGEDVRFDVERNWRLVAGLVEAADDQLQYIFVSRPLKRKLLEQARRVGAPERLRERARRVLHQPTGSLPHNDHFHVRIYCSEIDVASGCEDRGEKHPWYDDHADRRRRTVRRARELLADGAEADVRAAAARRLGLLEARETTSTLQAALDDPAVAVRVAAARTLGRFRRGSAALAERLVDERRPAAFAEMADALARIADEEAVSGLMAALDEGGSLDLPGGPPESTRVVAARALGRTESQKPVGRLVELLDADSGALRGASARALRFLTNQDFGGDFEEQSHEDAAADWRNWWEEYGDASRSAWLSRGFREAGYDVEELEAGAVWSMCRSIRDADHLSYNAQRTLMELSGRKPESLSWPKEDANFYWRRYFERRVDRYGLSEIPDEMTTLEGD